MLIGGSGSDDHSGRGSREGNREDRAVLGMMRLDGSVWHSCLAEQLVINKNVRTQRHKWQGDGELGRVRSNGRMQADATVAAAHHDASNGSWLAGSAT